MLECLIAACLLTDPDVRLVDLEPSSTGSTDVQSVVLVDQLDPHQEHQLILSLAAPDPEPVEAEPVEAEPEPPVEVDAEPEPPVREDEQPARNVWDRLAECESGNWIDGGASFEEGSARWGWGGSDPIPPWGTSIHDGGLQFLPDTWDWLKPDGFPARAYDATREQQIEVAERVLEVQGWKAWPVCSRKLGLR